MQTMQPDYEDTMSSFMTYSIPDIQMQHSFYSIDADHVEHIHPTANCDHPVNLPSLDIMNMTTNKLQLDEYFMVRL